MLSESKKPTPRPYRKRARAKQEEATRERITEATVRLHGSVGPARTTVAGIAREAGVQRATVYRHFPDEHALFEACTAHYWAQHAPPDIESWKQIRDPAERLRVGLAGFYDFYEENEAMIEKTSRDRGLVPAMEAPTAAFLGMLAYARDVLVRGRRERGKARTRVEAAVGHALFFPTWQSLVRQQGLEIPDAVTVMTGMVEAAGTSRAS